MLVKILSPQRLLFEGEAKEIVLPGEDGEFSVLDFHQACMYSLRKGQIKLIFQDKYTPKQRHYIKSGVALVEWGKLSVLIEELPG